MASLWHKKLRPVSEARKRSGIEGVWWTTFGKNSQIRQTTAAHQMWEKELISLTATIFAKQRVMFASDKDKILHLRNST
jgi:hypothetical protein